MSAPLHSGFTPADTQDLAGKMSRRLAADITA
jgi:hypothetical protein